MPATPATICCRAGSRSKPTPRTCAPSSIRKAWRCCGARANKGLALKLKQQLEALALTIGANAGEEGKLFGSVTNIDIERALREHGFNIERRKIMLAEPIKQLGEFTVPVRLDPEVEAGVKLTVAAS